MKNRLEDAYRQLKQSETPDLWDRIETGIKESTKGSTNANINESTNENAGYRKHKKTGRFLRKYSLPLAACIAVALCVPLAVAGFLKVAGGGNQYAADAEMAAEAENFAMTAESYEMAEEECAEAGYDAAAYENAAEEAVMAENAAADEEALTEDDSASGSSDAALDSGTEKQSGTEQSLQDQAEPFDGSRQTLTITGSSAGKEILGEGQRGGTIYDVTTVEQGECSVFVPADAGFSLLPGQSVRIVAEPGNEEYDYLFVKMAE